MFSYKMSYFEYANSMRGHKKAVRVLKTACRLAGYNYERDGCTRIKSDQYGVVYTWCPDEVSTEQLEQS